MEATKKKVTSEAPSHRGMKIVKGAALAAALMLGTSNHSFANSNTRTNLRQAETTLAHSISNQYRSVEIGNNINHAIKISGKYTSGRPPIHIGGILARKGSEIKGIVVSMKYGSKVEAEEKLKGLKGIEGIDNPFILPPDNRYNGYTLIFATQPFNIAKGEFDNAMLNKLLGGKVISILAANLKDF